MLKWAAISVTMLASTVAAQTNKPSFEVTVVVRLVDSGALPLPGIPVLLREVRDCASRAPGSAQLVKRNADADGSVSFAVAPEATYLIRGGDGDAGFEPKETCLRVFGPERYRYVQLQLRSDPAERITIIEPSVEPPEKTNPRRRLVAMEFAGVYSDSTGRKFVVDIDRSGEGLDVEPPDGEVLHFSKRVGDAFTGPGGKIRFVVVNGRVIAFTLMPKRIQAKLMKQE